MSPLLMLAILVAVVGFVLLLKPEPLWHLFQKNKDEALSKGMAALLRLVGIGVLFLSVVIAQQVH